MNAEARKPLTDLRRRAYRNQPMPAEHAVGTIDPRRARRFGYQVAKTANPNNVPGLGRAAAHLRSTRRYAGLRGGA